MTSKLISSPPPQTYSRLFRPWDGNQDSTITSTTAKKNLDNEDINKTSEQKQLSDTVKSEYDTTRINERLFDLNDHLHHRSSMFPLSHSEELQHIQQQTEAMAFYTNYPEFMTGLSPATYLHAAGAATMDPLTMNAMEQEYARVLAEEAQAKILSARKQRPKKFKCPHCDVAFSNNGQLKGHVRIHTGKFFNLNTFFIK